MVHTRCVYGILMTYEVVSNGLLLEDGIYDWPEGVVQVCCPCLGLGGVWDRISKTQGSCLQSI